MPSWMVNVITKMTGERVICILLLCLLPICAAVTIPIGMFRTECQGRHFWLAVRSSLLGQKFRFDVEDSSGVHTLSGQLAAECGYTMVLDSWGDLVLRASFLACYVENEKDSEFRLLVWFVNQDVDGDETTYPLQLTCPLHHPWGPREIVCEENYMEVSVMKQVPPSNYKGMEWMTPPPVWSDEGLREWRVVFHMPGHSQRSGNPSKKEETVPVEMVHLLGYHINTTETRILLRCAYGSRLSYTLLEKGIEVEVISATILYKHRWTLLRVDTSVACTTSKASMDGANILWTFPKVLSPLVQPPIIDRGLRVGVEGRFLSNCVAHHRGYQIEEQDGTVEIRIPFGAEGGYIKSHAVDGQYSQSYYIDLFYLHQWEDAQWNLTEYRSFRPLSIIHLLQTPSLINETVPSDGMFSVALGPFPRDVSLYNITVGNKPMSWAEADQLGFEISQVPFPNGTHAFRLQTPFSHPLVSQKYIGERHRRYTLAVTFTLVISPHAEIYHHPATVECALQDVVLPRMEGECTAKGVRLLLYYGSMDSQWEVYVGDHRLDWELVELGGYALENREDYFSMEVPLYGLGMSYEGISLQGLIVTVQVAIQDRETAKVEHTFTQRCLFPVRELLVCLPDGRMVVMVDTSTVSSAINPKLTSLLDPTCVPLETDGTRALYNFSLDSCGTIITLEEDYLVYTNEVRYSTKLLLGLKILSSPYPQFRIPIGCVHPVNGTRALTIYQLQALPLWLHSRASRSHHSGAQQHPFIQGQLPRAHVCADGNTYLLYKALFTHGDDRSDSNHLVAPQEENGIGFQMVDDIFSRPPGL